MDQVEGITSGPSRLGAQDIDLTSQPNNCIWSEYLVWKSFFFVLVVNGGKVFSCWPGGRPSTWYSPREFEITHSFDSTPIRSVYAYPYSLCHIPSIPYPLNKTRLALGWTFITDSLLSSQRATTTVG